MLTVSDLYVSVSEKPILNGITLTVNPGEIHALMGPNGSGKSTLAYSLMGHPDYTILKHKATHMKLDGKNILDMSPDERVRNGLFLAFQSPIAVPGVTVKKLMRALTPTGTSTKSKQKSKRINPVLKENTIQEIVAINTQIDKLAKQLSIKPELLNRSLNDDFSGGEKKKLEMLQMLYLKPKYVIIDEIDTGLDVDALTIVARSISTLANGGTGVIIITHYQRILKHVRPDHVHVMREGKIVKSGDASLAKEIERTGYTHM